MGSLALILFLGVPLLLSLLRRKHRLLLLHSKLRLHLRRSLLLRHNHLIVVGRPGAIIHPLDPRGVGGSRSSCSWNNAPVAPYGSR